MKLKYNAPVTLTFAFLCIGVLALKILVFPYLVKDFFTVPPHAAFVPTQAKNYLLLFSHIFGHADWNHLLGNLALILLLGPLLEESYGSPMLCVMMLTTALVTGVLNVCFSPKALTGSSGIAFMMILLSSFTNTDKNEIPLTFLIVLILYLVKDIMIAFEKDNISHFAHLIGGVCGSLFGYFRPSSTRRASRTTKSTSKRNTNHKTANQTNADGE
ncbi:MAG: rhomboid family intramembrane serine protease [Treponemataceae bacterium]